MNAAEQLPTYDHHGRHDLIVETARLAFEIEAAERRGDGPGQARRRIEYHRAMAELLARTAADNRQAQARIEWARRDHLQQADTYQHELEKFGAGGE